MSPVDHPDRRSRLVPGTFCAYGDLHNHSLLSDGSGDPARAFAQMRAAGLDVAALTDHASIPHDDLPELDTSAYPGPEAYAVARSAPRSLDEAAWARTAELADLADVPGEFTAIRGFEWTEPWLGHSNVWFSEHVRYVTTPGRVAGLHTWLADTEPSALFGYNHPGRERGRFENFTPVPGLVPRMVSLEAFNREDDYLFEGWHAGAPSPLVACLAAGWRPGLVGVSDEHSPSYGLAGKGRTGLWVRELSRAGVREALEARRMFATREHGLILEATLAGIPMGGALPGGSAELVVSLRGAHDGRPVELQVLGHGDGGAPAVLGLVRTEGEAVVRAAVELGESPWAVLRVADPTRRNRRPGPEGHPGNLYALAYASPWYVDAPA